MTLDRYALAKYFSVPVATKAKPARITYPKFYEWRIEVGRYDAAADDEWVDIDHADSYAEALRSPLAKEQKAVIALTVRTDRPGEFGAYAGIAYVVNGYLEDTFDNGWKVPAGFKVSVMRARQ